MHLYIWYQIPCVYLRYMRVKLGIVYFQYTIFKRDSHISMIHWISCSSLSYIVRVSPNVFVYVVPNIMYLGYMRVKFGVIYSGYTISKHASHVSEIHWLSCSPLSMYMCILYQIFCVFVHWYMYLTWNLLFWRNGVSHLKIRTKLLITIGKFSRYGGNICPTR